MVVANVDRAWTIGNIEVTTTIIIADLVGIASNMDHHKMTYYLDLTRKIYYLSLVGIAYSIRNDFVVCGMAKYTIELYTKEIRQFITKR